MNGLNYDPGLRQAFSQQTRQRLLSEANSVRLAQNDFAEDANLKETRRFNLTLKIKVIGEIIKDTGSAILNLMKATGDTLNA